MASNRISPFIMSLIYYVQFDGILHDINDKICQEFSIFCMTKASNVLFSMDGIIDYIEQLCHRPGGLFLVMPLLKQSTTYLVCMLCFCM